MEESRLHKLLHDEGAAFSEICSMMKEPLEDVQRHFLCLMNNIVEYCFSQTKESVNYHVIYLPAVPEWAEGLLARFLIHKMALASSDDFLQTANAEINRPIYYPLHINRRIRNQLEAKRRYYRDYVGTFGNLQLPQGTGKRALFVLRDQDIKENLRNGNPCLNMLYNTDCYDTNSNVIVTSDTTALDLESFLRRNAQRNFSFENVFVFHSRNRSRITHSYTVQQLNRLNQYGVGVKNCFFFYLQDEPFRLYWAIENIKRRICTSLLSRRVQRFDDFDGFITFDSKELDEIFDRKSKCARYEIKMPMPDIDFCFDGVSNEYKMRNALALAFDENIRKSFEIEWTEESGEAVPENLKQFLDCYEKQWKEDIEPLIDSELEGCRSVAFVLPWWAVMKMEYRNAFVKSFGYREREVRVIDVDAIENDKSDVIILFTYVYTDSMYKTYPNSIEQLPLHAGQKGLRVINRLTHDGYYQWNRYYYGKDCNMFLYSDFRKDKIAWERRLVPHPVIFDDTERFVEEAESDRRNVQAERLTVNFENGSHKVLLASAKALYRMDVGSEFSIASLKELASEEGTLEIQMLDELVDVIRESLVNRQSGIRKEEVGICRNYGLTDEQINSGIELWRYLLKRKVDDNGQETVYSEIFADGDESVSIHGFSRWLDFDCPVILPRSRKDQNRVLTYLGFSQNDKYRSVVLLKKLMRNNNTRMLNVQIEALLQEILLSSQIADDDFNKLLDRHSDILSSLEIRQSSEINTLKELLNIHLEKVERIEMKKLNE